MFLVKYNSSDHLTKWSWKFTSGESLGDMIEFENSSKGELRIVSEEPTQKVFCINKTLIVRHTEINKFDINTVKRKI